MKEFLTKKNFIYGIAIFVAVLLIFNGKPVEAAGSYDRVDVNWALAGASEKISTFFRKEKGAAEKIAQILSPLKTIQESATEEPDHETVYEGSKIGTVCVEGSLNIRSKTSVLSDVLTRAWRGASVEIVSEISARGVKWYRIRYGNVSGFVAAQYVLFGDDATAYFAALHEKLKSEAVIPSDFKADADFSKMSAPDAEALVNAEKQISFSLREDYPKAQEEGSYLNMYSVLIYLLENYQQISDIAKRTGQQNLYDRCQADIQTIAYLRETLEDTTGQTAEDFTAQIEEVRKERERKKSYSVGEQIANYAAQFVGSLPYVWGGASLTYGADCSGFAAQVFAAFGLLDKGTANIHGYDSRTLRGVGTGIAVSQIQPGDLVCYNGHVGIYYGNGMIVHEPSPGRRCSYGSLYLMPIITVRRMH